jgi:hypothetical protein
MERAVSLILILPLLRLWSKQKHDIKLHCHFVHCYSRLHTDERAAVWPRFWS